MIKTQIIAAQRIYYEFCSIARCLLKICHSFRMWNALTFEMCVYRLWIRPHTRAYILVKCSAFEEEHKKFGPQIEGKRAMLLLSSNQYRTHIEPNNIIQLITSLSIHQIFNGKVCVSVCLFNRLHNLQTNESPIIRTRIYLAMHSCKCHFIFCR